MTHRDKTRLVHVARRRATDETIGVNPPIVRASTVLYKDIATMRAMAERRRGGERVFTYGIRGTPTTYALEDALNEIEQGSRTMLFPSGLAAIAHVFLSVLKPGDHALLAETIYGPGRNIAERYLANRGITCEFYPGGHEEIAQRLKPETRIVYLDNPGSIVFDVQDVPAIVRTVAGRDILVAVDNSWGAPGLCRPLELGADISVVAITKYTAGHSDLAMGSVTANERSAGQLWRDANVFCESVSPDDAYMALRGLRTAVARMTMQHAHAMEVIGWLERHPLIERILFPALASHPGHAIWKRDFSGANSLFSVVFRPGITQQQANHFVDRLQLFGIGASWGGFESLAITYPDGVYGWNGGALVRLHIGLEDPADLIADIEQALGSVKV